MKRTLNKIVNVSLLLLSSSCVLASSWQPYPGYIPYQAFVVGHERNGTQLFLCKTRFKNSTQLGKTWRNYHYCNIGYGGKEIVLSQYSIFVADNSEGYWGYTGGIVPEKALQAGIDTNGRRLFLCKTSYQGGVQPGKTWPGYDKCNISYAGKEISRSDYTIFILH